MEEDDMGPFDEPERPKRAEIRVGDDLASVSLEELRLRIETLTEEIERVRAEIARKQASRDAADSVFRT